MTEDLLKTPLRWVISFIKDFIYDKVCYVVGWLMLRILTIGNYPSESLTEGLKESESNSFIDDTNSWTTVVGALCLCAIGLLFYKTTH